MTRNYSLHSHYPGLELGTLFYHPTDISFSDQTPRNDPIAFQLRVDSYDQKVFPNAPILSSKVFC